VDADAPTVAALVLLGELLLLLAVPVLPLWVAVALVICRLLVPNHKE
jgi:hypothetical protein